MRTREGASCFSSDCRGAGRLRNGHWKVKEVISMQMSWSWVAAGVVALGVVGAVGVALRDEPTKPAVLTLPSVAPKAPRGELPRVNGEPVLGLVRDLQRRVAELESAQPSEPSAPPSPATNTEPLKEEQAAHAAEMRTWTPEERRARYDQRVADLAVAFDNEPVDAEWSQQTVATLEKSFEEMGFEGSTLREAKCRKTFCRVLVSHDDVVARQDFERFTSAVPGMGGKFVFRESASGLPETLAYFIRPGFNTREHLVRQPL